MSQIERNEMLGTAIGVDDFQRETFALGNGSNRWFRRAAICVVRRDLRPDQQKHFTCRFGKLNLKRFLFCGSVTRFGNVTNFRDPEWNVVYQNDWMRKNVGRFAVWGNWEWFVLQSGRQSGETIIRQRRRFFLRDRSEFKSLLFDLPLSTFVEAGDLKTDHGKMIAIVWACFLQPT